jgi:hypothetical protein
MVLGKTADLQRRRPPNDCDLGINDAALCPGETKIRGVCDDGIVGNAAATHGDYLSAEQRIET